MIVVPPTPFLHKFGSYMSAVDHKAQAKEAQIHKETVQHIDGRLKGMFSMWLNTVGNANVDGGTSIDINADCKLYSDFLLHSRMRKERRGEATMK